MGRRMEQTLENYSPEHFRSWNDDSRANLGVDTLDLVQLHCPPTPVYHAEAVFDDLDAMVAEERIRAYGVSVETIEQALAACERPHVDCVPIVLIPFRQVSLEAVLPADEKAGVDVIERELLASDLLSGRYTT